jgi:hypothetical protein
VGGLIIPAPPWSAKVRALKGWADLNAINHLGIGTGIYSLMF